VVEHQDRGDKWHSMPGRGLVRGWQMILEEGPPNLQLAHNDGQIVGSDSPAGFLRPLNVEVVAGGNRGHRPVGPYVLIQ